VVVVGVVVELEIVVKFARRERMAGKVEWVEFDQKIVLC